jgi:hypothetical protein
MHFLRKYEEDKYSIDKAHLGKVGYSSAQELTT